MKKLVIARHGVYDNDYELSPTGVEQMRRLAERLKPIVAPGSRKIIVLASTSPRGKASGDVMAEALGCPVEHHEVLWSESSHPEDPPEALKLIQSKGAEHDVVIVVTHLEYIECLPSYIGKHVFGGVKFNYVEIPKGEAWFLDFTRKTCTRVP